MNNLELKSVKKRFPGVDALKGFSFALEPGKIYGLVGENGAGKSTLVKILMGLYQPDEGEIFLSGEALHVESPYHARHSFGIDAVFQDHALIPKMSIAENVFLDKLKYFYKNGLIDKGSLEIEAVKVLEKVGLDLNVADLIENTSEAERSLIDLAKSLSNDPQYLILDEMTAPLVSSVVDELFEILHRLKKEGKTILFISHRLEEVLNICEEIIVLKDGNFEGMVKNSGEQDQAAIRKQIIRMMTGSEKGLSFPDQKTTTAKDEAILSIRNFSNKRIHGINLDIRKGEIVALAGLDGQGQSVLLRAIAGLHPNIEGEVILNGKSLRIKHIYDSIKNGIFYVSDRRDEEELWLSHDIWKNISVASAGSRGKLGFINLKKDRAVVQDMIKDLKIEPPSLAKIVRQLSGGNRQKVVLGKSLLCKPKILLLDQPTIGLDIGAKMEIYKLIRELVDEGIPVLTVLTDCEEVVNLPDRVLVMHEGKIAKEFTHETINEEELLDSYYG